MGAIWSSDNKIFSVNNNGAVPKPTASDVSAGKVLKADGTWGEGGGSSGTFREMVSISQANLNGVALTEQVRVTKIS